MPTPRPNLTIVVQNKIGGVQNFFVNLLRAGAFRDFNTLYLAIEWAEDIDTKLPAPLAGAPMQVHRYFASENCYHGARRLAAHIPAGPGLAFTNHFYELRCLDTHRRPDLTIVHFCHDEFYIEIASTFAHIIDIFVAHNPHFVQRLKERLPKERNDDVLFLPFGIPQDVVPRRSPNLDRPLRIVFIGRLHRLKGILELPVIDDHLRALGCRVEWQVLGSGPESSNLERLVAGKDNFAICSPSDNSEILRQAATGDVFVLPSRLDGTPLAVMEAMSVGLVPLVSEFNPGAHWMIPTCTGFVGFADPLDFAVAIARLDANRAELEARSDAASEHAREHFDEAKRAELYATTFARWSALKKPHNAPVSRYGSRLDHPWVPNAVTVTLRCVRGYFSALKRPRPIARDESVRSDLL